MINCAILLILLLNYNLTQCFQVEKLNNKFVHKQNDYEFYEINESPKRSYNYEKPVQKLWQQNPLLDSQDRRHKNSGNKVPQLKRCPSCACGSTANKRIVGGTVAEINEFPFQVALTYKKNVYCGATLINDLYVLTAAHCTYRLDKNKIECRFLVNDITNSSKSFSRQISNVWRTRGFNNNTYAHDLAILKLKSKVPITSTSILRPICLPKLTINYKDQLGTLIGWGRTNENQPKSKVLRKVKVPILTYDECLKTSSGSIAHSDDICAGVGGKNVCFGDSGGPLLVYQNKRYIQIGIISRGYGCALPNYPGVFTKVTRYLPHIMRVASQGSCFCSD